MPCLRQTSATVRPLARSRSASRSRRTIWSAVRRLLMSPSWTYPIRIRTLITGGPNSGGQTKDTLEGRSRFREVIALSGDGCHALTASGGADHTLRYWDLVSGHCKRVVQGHTGPVLALALSGDGRRAVSGSWDYTLRWWDLE